MEQRIAILAGICTRHDAISNIVRAQQQILVDAGHDVTVFVHHSDFDDPRHVEVTDAWMLQRDDRYRDADIVILHFGIQYGLFDSLCLSHPGQRVVRFHNVTPPALLSGPARRSAVAGIDQLSVAANADRVWSDSEHNSQCLLEWTDVESARIELMPLCTPLAELEPSTAPRSKRVLAVGRIVPAKGQLDLVDAVGRLSAELLDGLEVRIVGSLDASDPAYLDEVQRRIGQLGVGHVVGVQLDPADSELHELYCDSAVFVSTSRHEGFCVPVIEALASGCRVVATDAGALPETVGPCGELVAVGDVEALTSALRRSLQAGPLLPAELETRALHLQAFTPSAFARQLREAVDAMVQR